ncbi:MAG: histone deacetylase family protein [SAR324 cluster bacterium]|nr:histone deacetylase family protein [SAR324 cluster bacterium]
MKVFYHSLEQNYAPRHSFFNGVLVPYPDVPGRTRNILAAIEGDARFEMQPPPAPHSAAPEALHGPGFVEAMEAVCGRLREDEQFFPFLARPAALLLKSAYPRIRMGYYTVDGSTPLLAQSYQVVLAAAATATAGAQALLEGERLAYAIPRPPGHHAGREFFAGYCLFNNAALAAVRLGEMGKVAILDVDFHHGNGSQDIFYDREDVLYVSLHCRPEEAYPYIAGSREEGGAGKGRGCNVNLPLPAGTAWEDYEAALQTALEHVRRFAPQAVVLSAGFDTLAQDPIGLFSLEIDHMQRIGRMIAGLGLPLLVVQEGGYHVPSLGACALKLFDGLIQ